MAALLAGDTLFHITDVRSVLDIVTCGELATDSFRRFGPRPGPHRAVYLSLWPWWGLLRPGRALHGREAAILSFDAAAIVRDREVLPCPFNSHFESQRAAPYTSGQVDPVAALKTCMTPSRRRHAELLVMGAIEVGALCEVVLPDQQTLLAWAPALAEAASRRALSGLSIRASEPRRIPFFPRDFHVQERTVPPPPREHPARSPTAAPVGAEARSPDHADEPEFDTSIDAPDIHGADALYDEAYGPSDRGERRAGRRGDL